MANSEGAATGPVGAPVRRVEDNRLVRGAGCYVDDLSRTNTLYASFLRSPHAHAKLRGIDLSRAKSMPGVVGVFDGEALAAWCQPLRPPIPVPGLIATEWAPLARGVVRYSGEAIAVVLADSRAEADLAVEAIEIDYEPLPVAIDALEASTTTTALVHEAAGTNVLYKWQVSTKGVEDAFRAADLVVRGSYTTQRATGTPIEPRGCLAEYDERAQGIELWSSTQIPHILRTGLSAALQLDENRIRVIAPDVGGGFGVKGQLFPEEMVVCALAREIRRPVKWIETRQEHLAASIHSREHRYELEAAVRRDGKILALRAEIMVDGGAYSVYPYTMSGEPNHALRLMTGVYDIGEYVCVSRGIATNKCPIAPYRGVSRPPANFALERLIDTIAQRLDTDPAEIRLKNLIRKEQFPYKTASGAVLDSGDYHAGFELALDTADYRGFRKKQARNIGPSGKARGVGLSIYYEATAGGAASFQTRGLAVAGFDMATVRVLPTGVAEVFTSAASQGQGHETIFAQIVTGSLNIALEDVLVGGGDTRAVPFGTGTFGSRSAVMAGGAVFLAAQEVREQALKIAALLLQAPKDEVILDDSGFRGPNGAAVSWRSVAEAAHFATNQLPKEILPGLHATRSYDLPAGQSPTSYGIHVAFVEVDIQTGKFDVTKYVVMDDCGAMINPMIVEGQNHGAFAQGFGTAVMEEIVYDRDGQLVTGSFMDYAIPRASTVPKLTMAHMVTKSPYTIFGAKGMAEGASVAPPAALANAIVDALRKFDVDITALPLTPERVWAAIEVAREKGSKAS